MDGSATIPPQMSFATPNPRGSEVLVIGLGNILLGDEGIGVHIVRRLATNPGTPAGLRPLDGGTLGFRLMDAFARSNAILLVDAAEFGEPAGTIRLLEREALNRHVRRGGRISAHEAGLVDLLTLAKLEGHAPLHLALLGVQPERIDWDETLSVPLARALPIACQMAIDTVLQWRQSA